MTTVDIEELFVKTFVQSILYGSESWNFTIPTHDPKRVEAMAMYTWCKIIKISWAERK